MQRDQTYVDTQNGKIYVYLDYKLTLQKIADEYSRVQRITGDNYRFIRDGLLNNTLEPITKINFNITINNLITMKDRLVNGINKALSTGSLEILHKIDFIKTVFDTQYDVVKHGTPVDFSIKLANEMVTNYREIITLYSSKLSDMNTIYAKNTEYMKDIESKFSVINSYTALVYLGFMKMTGSVLFTAGELIKEKYIYDDNITLMFRIVLKKFIEQYLLSYTYRKSNIDKLPFYPIDLENILIGLSPDLLTITDLVCPELYIAKNNQTPLSALDIAFSANGSNMEVSVNGTSVATVPFNEPIIQLSVETNDEPFAMSRVFRTTFWKHEFAVVIKVILKLCLVDSLFSHSDRITNNIDDVLTYFDIINEGGATVTEDQMYTLITTLYKHNGRDDVLKFASKICTVFMTNHSPDKLTKSDFDEDMNKVLDIVNQYV